MASPSQLNITITQNNNGTVTTSTVIVPIPPALQGLDSGGESNQGQVSQQTGFSAVESLIRSIFSRGAFYVAATKTWYPAYLIQNITFQ